MRMKKLLKTLLFTFILIGILVGINTTVNAASKKTIALNKKNVTVYVGNSTTLSLKGTNKKVYWLTSNKKVAKVSKKGKVTGIKAGKATITAKLGKKSYKCKVTVKNVSLSKKNISIKYGKKATIKLNGGKIKKVKSSNIKVATVTKSGKITAKKTGKATITVTSTKNKKYTCKVTVVAYLSNTNAEILVGNSKTIKLNGEKIKSIKSSNTKVATVTKKGKITAKKAGKTTITVISTKNKKYKCKVVVKNRPKTEYTVTFNTNGGTNIASQKVKYNTLLVKPDIPTKNGYIFGSWYTDKELKQEYDFSTRVKSNFSLYASWIAIDKSDETYTRGEWIQMLAEMVDMNLDCDKEELQYHFADTEDSKYGIAIETAYAYNLLPEEKLQDELQDVSYFYPDKIAEREFVAYTLSKAMGFTDDESTEFKCEDKNKLNYQTEVQSVVKADFMRLDNGYFNPSAPLSKDDISLIKLAVERTLDSETVSAKQIHNDNLYAEGVIKEELNGINDYIVKEKEDGSFDVSVTKNSKTNNIKLGKVIVLPKNDKYPDGIALKVSKITDLGKKYQLICTEPELEEVYSVIDFAGKAKAQVDQITGTNGVSVSYDPEATDDEVSTMGNINLGGSTALPGKLTFDMPATGYKFSDDLKLKGSVEIKIPDITCKFNADLGLKEGISLNEFTFSMSQEIKIKESLELTLAESGYELTNSAGNTRFEQGRIEIGRVPFEIVPELSLDLVVFVDVSAKGNVNVSYTIYAKEGIQYKDGSVRLIKDFRDSLDLIQIKGSASVTIGNALDLCAFHMFDVVGISLEAGPAFEASFTPHVLATDTLFCSDVALYLTVKVELDQETVVGKFLKKVKHYTLEKEIFKNDSKNPFRVFLHIENSHLVDECTFGVAKLTGSVVDAVTNSAISGARIQVYTTSPEKLVRTKYTNSDGNYSIDNLADGTYKVSISANNYKRYDMEVEVKKNSTIYAETAKMLARTNSSGKVIVSSTDGLTGSELSGVKYNIRSGWNNTSGEIIMSGDSSDSEFELELPSGNYTLEVTKEKYIKSQENIAVIADDTIKVRTVLSPETIGDITDTKNIRIILTWGETPFDLDSHLFGPYSDNSEDRFHTYYGDKDAYNDDDKLIANLDVDDINSYGPETTTIYEISEGIYSFYVHDYTNQDDENSTSLSNSEAKVRIYTDDILYATFNIPRGKVGTVWHVFDYDSNKDEVIPINTISNTGSEVNLLSINSEQMNDMTELLKDVIKNPKLDNKK